MAYDCCLSLSRSPSVTKQIDPIFGSPLLLTALAIYDLIMHPPVEVLGAMITPAVLISAAALLLLSTAGRLARVNDRLQHLMGEAEKLLSHQYSELALAQRRQLNIEHLTSLEQRLLLLRSAVTALYITIGLLLLTSILTGMYVLFPQVTAVIPTSLGLFGAIAFLYSVAVLTLEATAAARVTLQEISYARSLLERSEPVRGKNSANAA